jgi:hypothetical protein
MIRARSELALATQTTEHRTAKNRHPLRCEMCREFYSVDEGTVQRVYSALTYDPSNIPSSCENCEAGFAEASYL